MPNNPLRKLLQRFTQSSVGKKMLQTVGGPASIQALESALAPIATAKNKYESFQAFLRMDPELNNAIMRLALLTQFAYKGIIVHADKDLSEKEKDLQIKANQAAEELELRSKFFAIAKHLLRDGDEVFVINQDENVGVQQFQPLPIARLTAIEKMEQFEDLNAQIFAAKFYILNEGVPNKSQIFPENDSQKVFHISLDNYGEEIRDLMGRYTFGVWSESPLLPLRARVLWKQAILITDILWRYRNVPREVHEINTENLRPEQFEGTTWETKFSNYQTAVKNLLKKHAKEIKKKKVDQGYVVAQGTKIYYTEPSRVQYTSPNQIIDQINQSIREGMGAYNVEAGTYATALVVSSYVVLLPDYIAHKIATTLLKVLKMHLREKYKFAEEEIDKLQIRLSLILDIFRGELVRQLALLAASGTWTLDELREYVGKLPLTDEQIERLVTIASKGGRESNIQTLLDLVATAGRSPGGEPITPESRRDRQET